MILAVIPARKGSKGVPHKNRALVAGKELIRFTLDEAVKAPSLGGIVLSTDDPEITKLAARDYPSVNSRWERPAALATDSSRTVDVVLHVLDMLEKEGLPLPEAVALLQPTSPLRTAADIETAITLFRKAGSSADSLVSLAALEEPHPYKVKRIENGLVAPFIPGTSSEVPRQELPPAYRLNGAIYIARTELLRSKKTFFGNTLPYVMPAERSLNIDSKSDLQALQNLVG